MSIGRPQSFSDLVSAPPNRGSFPLDHYGECKEAMKAYLSCLSQNKATSTPCRIEGKAYLECRMTKGLMERDEWRNIGMGGVGAPATPDESNSKTAVPETDSARTGLDASKKS